MNDNNEIIELIERAILEVKDEILEREEILYKNYGILNLLSGNKEDSLT